MNKQQNVPIFLDCKVGGVVPVTASIELIKSNYISKNIVDKTAKIVKDKEDCMYPHIDNDVSWISHKKGNEIGIIYGLWFTVKNSKGKEIVIGHKDNYFTVIEEPNILILGTPWLWLFEVSLNLHHEYLTTYHYKDKIKIYGRHSQNKRIKPKTKKYKKYKVIKIYNSNSSPESDTNSSNSFESDTNSSD